MRNFLKKYLPWIIAGVVLLVGWLLPNWLPWLLLALTLAAWLFLPRRGLIGPVELPADDAFLPTEQVQWWYWTGHLLTDDGRRFGTFARIHACVRIRTRASTHPCICLCTGCRRTRARARRAVQGAQARQQEVRARRRFGHARRAGRGRSPAVVGLAHRTVPADRRGRVPGRGPGGGGRRDSRAPVFAGFNAQIIEPVEASWIGRERCQGPEPERACPASSGRHATPRARLRPRA